MRLNVRSNGACLRNPFKNIQREKLFWQYPFYFGQWLQMAHVTTTNYNGFNISCFGEVDADLSISRSAINKKASSFDCFAISMA